MLIDIKIKVMVDIQTENLKIDPKAENPSVSNKTITVRPREFFLLARRLAKDFKIQNSFEIPGTFAIPGQNFL